MIELTLHGVSGMKTAREALELYFFLLKVPCPHAPMLATVITMYEAAKRSYILHMVLITQPAPYSNPMVARCA